jgi:hypothetical protein
MKKIFVIFILILLPLSILYSQNQKISSPFSQAKFVPNISAILDFSYIYRDIDDLELDRTYLPGYATIGDDYNYGLQGFSFNYFELALESVVDPYFDLFAVFQFTNGEFSIEEAFFKTRSLPAGFQIKAGKFFSGFGRLNAQHDHIWNFCDQPLVYKSIFGTINLNDLGVQLNWVAPTDLFLKLGFEIFQGQNQDSYSFYNEDMTIGDTLYERLSVPLFVGFLKTSTDINNFVLLGGISYATGKINKFYEETGYGLTGNSNVWGIDLTIKYLIDSYRYLNLQSEFLLRTQKGDLVSELDIQRLDKKQHGFYSELVWRFKRRWRCGLRYDLVKGGDNLYLDENSIITGDLTKFSAMIEFNATEFSRIRIQYNYNKAKVLDNELKGFSEIFINCNLAIGAHGAHKF